MNAEDARKKAERLLPPRAPDDPAGVSDREARARDIRRKIEYLRSLRLAAQARRKVARSDSTD